MSNNLIEIVDLTFRRGERLIFDSLNLTVPAWEHHRHYGTERDG